MSYNCDQREEQEDGAPDEQFETNKKQHEVGGGQPPATGGDYIGDENRHMVIDSAVTKVPHPDVNSTKEIVTLPAHSTDYKLPLYLLIKDKQVKVEIEREKVAKLQGEVERLSAFYSRHPGVDHSKPACQTATAEKDIIDLTAHLKVMPTIPLNSVGILINIKTKTVLCPPQQTGCSAQRNFSRN